MSEMLLDYDKQSVIEHANLEKVLKISEERTKFLHEKIQEYVTVRLNHIDRKVDASKLDNMEEINKVLAVCDNTNESLYVMFVVGGSEHKIEQYLKKVTMMKMMEGNPMLSMLGRLMGMEETKDNDIDDMLNIVDVK